MTTHLQTLKQAMGSHQITTVPRNSASKNTGFISKCDRFTVKTEDYIPGPGAYDGQIKEKHTSDYRVLKDDSKYSYGREHQWIIEEGRMPYQKPQSNGIYLGPGSYNQKDTAFGSTGSPRSGWSKGSRFNYKLTKEKVGPGAYNQRMFETNQGSCIAVFKSRSPKCFLDALVAQQSKKKTPTKNKSQVINPEANILEKYEHRELVRSEVVRPQSIFLSKCERGSLVNHNSTANLGPGCYNLNIQTGQVKATLFSGPARGIMENIKCQKKLKSFKHVTDLKSPPHKYPSESFSPLLGGSTSKKPKQSAQSLKFGPGPGQYNISSNITDRQALFKGSALGTLPRQQRFVEHKVEIMPGPGQYNQQKYIYISEDMLKGKAKGRHEKEQFGVSGVERGEVRNKEDTPFLKYNVDQLDLEYKLRKQREHQNRLKYMEVQLPAFNSRLPRLV